VFTCENCTLPPSHECELCQQIGSVETFRIQHLENSGQVSCRAINGTPRSSFRALLTASNWRDYFTEISDKKHLVSNFVKSDFSLDKTLLQALPDLEMQEAVRRVWFLLVATELLTMPLTILAALGDNSSDIAARKTILIHLIGACGRELANLMLFEEILHLVPSLETLRIVLIGPGSVPAAEQMTRNEFALESCPACSFRGKKRTLAFYRGLYNKYVEESQYQKPDLAVLFQSGRSQDEQESWRPTTEFLVESGTLTVCTTFTHREALEEVVELDTLGARFVRQSEVNKCKSLVPLLQLLESAEHAVYYRNYYRYIFQGRR
jgi:splicing suppressor protein 51